MSHRVLNLGLKVGRKDSRGSFSPEPQPSCCFKDNEGVHRRSK